MLRIFVTGDNHIGRRYLSYGKETREILRKKRLSALDGMVDAANREGCHLLVVTGDLFDNTYSVTRQEVEAALETLSGFRGVAAVLPGNHDYYDETEKLWQYFHHAIETRDNILLLSRYRPYPLQLDGKEAVLYPALCTSKHSAPGKNNLGWIKAEDIPQDGAFHIGVAHGAVEGETIDSEGEYFLMGRAELEAIPMDVWLIGHTHVPFPRTLTDRYERAGRIFNAGAHVQTDAACGSDGQCFIIELADDKTVRAKKFHSGNLRFYRRELALSAGELEKAVAAALEPMEDDSVVELTLSGCVTTEEYQNRAAFLEQALARFLRGSYDDHHLSELISRERIEREFPETSFAARLLVELLPDPRETQWMYELIKTVGEGKK